MLLTAICSTLPPARSTTHGVSRTRGIHLALAGLFAAGASAALAQDATPSADEVSLGRFVVTAAGFQQEIQQAPASISLIGREELLHRRVNHLADALGEIEGVDIGGTAGKTGGLNISIRGMPSDYTLILIDGRRQNVAGNVTPNGFGETSTSFLPPLAAIERI